MKNKIKGEVTVEVAIVFPIIILIVISLIYFAFLIHDLLVIKSYAYSAGLENASYSLEEFNNNVQKKVSKAPVLVTYPIVKCYSEINQYIIEVNGRNTSKLKTLSNIMEGETIRIKIQKNIDRNNIYAVRGIIDIAKE